MKKVHLMTVVFVFMSLLTWGQTKITWVQMDNFHALMSATFHPAEEGNLVPLKQKADSLYKAAKLWKQSPIPPGFKEAETKAALKELLKQCDHIRMAVKEKMPDDHLKKIIGSAHDTFHKISGECRKKE